MKANEIRPKLPSQRNLEFYYLNVMRKLEKEPQNQLWANKSNKYKKY